MSIESTVLVLPPEGDEPVPVEQEMVSRPTPTPTPAPEPAQKLKVTISKAAKAMKLKDTEAAGFFVDCNINPHTEKATVEEWKERYEAFLSRPVK